MSHSVFKEYDALIDNTDNIQINCNSAIKRSIDTNLVVIINKDGNVTVDQEGLQEFLTNDTEETNTSISVIHVGSPTPSLKQSMLEDEESDNLETSIKESKKEKQSIKNIINKKHLNNSEGDNNEDEKCSDQEGSDGRIGSDTDNEDFNKENVQQIGLTIEKFFTPLQAKQLAADILGYAGISNPKQLRMNYEFQRMVIANDHCYTNLRASDEKEGQARQQQNIVNSENNLNQQQLKIAKRSTKQQKPVHKKSVSDNDEEQSDEHIIASQDSSVKDDSDIEPSDLSPSESDNDRDSDLDFSVNDRSSARNKKLNRRCGNSVSGLNGLNILSARTNRQYKIGKESKRKQNSLINLDLTLNDISDEQITFTEKSQKKRQNNLKTKSLNTNKQLKFAKKIKNKIVKSEVMVHNSNTISEKNKIQEAVNIISPNSSINKPITQSSINKKEKKPAAHVEALITDISSLFSAPDIMKKVSSVITTTTSLNAQKIIEDIKSASPIQNKNNEGYFLPLTPNASDTKNQQQLLSQISIRTHIPTMTNHQQHHQQPEQVSCSTLTTSIPDTTAQFAIEQDKQLELIDLLVQERLNTNTPPTTRPSTVITGNYIPNIVKMLENPNEMVTNVIHLNESQLANQPIVSNIIAMTTNTSSNTYDDAPLLDDIDLLEGLPTSDDGLPDDLLQHVAKLVEDKNVQEVLDKQVLGVVSTASMASSAAIVSAAQTINIQNIDVPSHSHNAQSELLDCVVINDALPTNMNIIGSTTPIISTIVTNINRGGTLANISSISSPNDNNKIMISASSPNSPFMTPVRKEPILVKRKDGRVITLPPIEAPTTRGAKRRAKNDTPLSSASSTHLSSSTEDISYKSVADSDKTTKESSKDRKNTGTQNKKNPNQSKSRQPQQNSSQRNNKGGKRDTNDDDNNDDDDSDENSEDDPYRLWCICRQPHNNRFMICCDKCEDWFHGKCVNVTKVMGMEMELRGVEWVCPNCTKKPVSLQANQEQQADKPAPVISSPVVASVVPEATISRSSLNESVQQPCIVCRKSARPNSIYCSHECILQHAQSSTLTNRTLLGNTVTTTTSTITSSTKEKLKPMVLENNQKNLSEKETQQQQQKQQEQILLQQQQHQQQEHTLPLQPYQARQQMQDEQSEPPLEEPPTFKLLKNKNNRVIVMEPLTGRCLTGSGAPTVDNLRNWLQENPTFEVVPEGSKQAFAIRAKQLQIKKDAEQQLHLERNTKKLFSPSPMKTTNSIVLQHQHQKPTPKTQTTLKVTPMNRVIYVNPKDATKQSQYLSASNHSSSLSTNVNYQGTKMLQQIPQVKSIEKIPKTAAPQHPTTKLPMKSSPVKSSTNLKLSRQSSAALNTTSIANALASTTIISSSKNKHNNESNKQSSNINRSRDCDFENVRISVQRTLKEQLTVRMSEVNDNHLPKLNEDEIERFVNDTESEIYQMFNCDTGTKYRSKYRSLIFNIKDRKNLSLFEKICNKKIEPKQLVRMSPEELASQELAKWRENENKHQLEMIKKSELDLLACAKNYVLKTHKGEEVFENKLTDRVTLDPSISVEDVVSILNSSTVSSTSEMSQDQPDTSLGSPTPQTPLKDTVIDSRYEKYLGTLAVTTTTTDWTTNIANTTGSMMTTTTTTKTTTTSSSNSSSTKPSKKSHSRHSLSKDLHEKSRSSNSNRSTSSKCKSRNHRSHEHDKERGDHKLSSRSYDKERISRNDKDRTGGSSAGVSERSDKNIRCTTTDTKRLPKKEGSIRDKMKSKTFNKETALTKIASKISTDLKLRSSKESIILNKIAKQNNQNNGNLIDKILEEQSKLDRILFPSKSLENKSKKMKDPTHKSIYTAGHESDQEPTSTVTIPTSSVRDSSNIDDEFNDYPSGKDNCNTDGPVLSTATQMFIYQQPYYDKTIWTGNLSMIDVATFPILLRGISGDFKYLHKEFPIELDVVGRISPDTVWDYIGKIRKSSNKEILLLRMEKSSEDEESAYTILYTYLESRKRLGVVKTQSTVIKDFYVLPLAANKSLPSVLIPSTVDDTSVIFEPRRPDLLIGIIVKVQSIPLPKRRLSTLSAITTQLPGIPTKKIKITARSNNDIALKMPKSLLESVVEGPYINTPPGSPKTLSIKSTAKSTSLKIGLTNEMEDGDEPYSPGDSDEENNIFAKSKRKLSTSSSTMTSLNDTDEIQRKMDEINRQIEASKMEIDLLQSGAGTVAGLVSGTVAGIGSILATDDLLDNEPYSPTSATTSSQIKQSIPTLANISIPSNLKEILNSITNKHVTSASSAMTSSTSITPSANTAISPISTSTSTSETLNEKNRDKIVPPILANIIPTPFIGSLNNLPVATATSTISNEDPEEYSPLLPPLTVLSSTITTKYIPAKNYASTLTTDIPPLIPMLGGNISTITGSYSGNVGSEPSRLAQLTDDELLSMVPDDIKIDTFQASSYKPTTSSTLNHKTKVSKYDLHEPPPPGLEDEYVP